MRILYVTTISLTMNAFFKPHIDMLIKEGHEVDIACNYSDLAIDEFYINLGCKIHQIDFSRSPLSKDNFSAYGQLKNVIKNGKYDVVHCHTPNASVITRLVCRKFRKKNGLKVFYTAHGFHFFNGAPLKNWLLYYPIEKFCSRFTDKLITINQEDYELAKNKFKAKEVHYVPGVGIDLSRFENVQVDRAVKRREIGVPEDVVLMTSVGELSVRKNHKVILQALAQIGNKECHYVVVGTGDKKNNLLNLANQLGVSEQVHFLDYRKDVAEIYKASDICCFPSVHEGLPVALMEAMACGLPCVVSKIRGNVDLIDENGGFISEFDNVGWFANAISTLNADSNLRKSMGEYNNQRSHMYDINVIVQKMKEVYELE